ncbi:MAG: O-antigen ligase family protein [Bacteroidota bacterium]|nr:O-antigen ligase family protein [Bacteroidota bacterium]
MVQGKYFNIGTDNFKIFLYMTLVAYISLSIVIFNVLPKYAFFIVPVICFLPYIVYLAYSNINMMFLLYIASIPLIQHFSFYNIELGDFRITPHMMVQLVLLISLIGNGLLTKNKIKFNYSNVDKAFLLFFVLSIIPLMIGYTFEVNHVKRWLLFYTGVIETIILYFVLRYLLNSEQITSKQVITALLCTSFASVIVAIFELNSIGTNLIAIYTSRMGIGFGYHNTNLFGIHSTLLFPLTIYALADKEFSQYRKMALCSFLILTFLSIICFNRGTFLVLGFQLFLLFFYKQNRKVIYWIVFGAIILGLVFSDLLALYVLRFFAGSGTEATVTVVDNSANYRLEAWKAGLLIIFHYPFGVGAGGFQHMWEIYGTIPNLFLGTPHHLLLSIGVDYGIPCLFLFLVIFFATIKKSKKLFKENKENNSKYFYIIVSLIGFITYGLITDGELSHLSGSIAPNNGYTLVLFSLIAVVISEFTDKKSV